MAIGDNTGLIDLEVNKIINNPNIKKDMYEYTVWLHTEKDNILVEMLENIEWLKDYNSNVTDFIVITFHLMGGDFIRKLYPYKDSLEATLIKNNRYGTEGPVSIRYKMILLNNDNGVEGSEYSKMTEDELNKTYKFKCEAQLVLIDYEGLRSVTFGGIYKNTDVTDVVLNAFTTVQEKLLKINGVRLGLNITMDNGNNEYKYKQIVVPTGMSLLDFPSWLQNSEYGVYNGNIGTYFTVYLGKKCIYVYPLYYTESINVGNRLMVFHANTSKYENIDNTYYVDGASIKIICGNNITNEDKGSTPLINEGSAIVANDPNSVLNRSFNVTNDKVEFDKNARLKGASIITRRDGGEKVIYAGTAPNMYIKRSIMLKNTMSFYQIIWKYCDFDLLRPGMKVTFVYEDSKYGITRLNGVVQSGYCRYQATDHTQHGILNLMVQNPNILRAEKEQKEKNTVNDTK